ncbi:MAG TPA: hypothetical protein VLE97_10670 [Gaiellaceae bacterium]|nr:hypothetical protein [Gaiellaceae bacterium]
MTKPEPSCSLCEAGFRRVDGIHIGSQRLGMIPNRPCERVFATCDLAAPDLSRSWLAYVDGEPLRTTGGEPRRYATSSTARRAARRAAPRMWHP